MNNLLKNKMVLAGVGLVVLLLVVGGVFLINSKKAAQTTDNQNANALPTSIPVPTITADSIGLTLKPGIGGKTVIASVANPAGITNMEFTLTYTALVNNEDVVRGATGQIDPAKKPASKEITLGTCSDVCHYDSGVKAIKLILKITKDDGKVYQSEASLDSVSK